MSTITTEPNQSILDVAINNCGSIAAAMELCAANNIPISLIPSPGSELEGAAVADNDVLKALRRYKLRIGTANLMACPIMIACEPLELTTTTASFEVRGGSGGVGIEWKVLEADEAAPESGTAVYGDGVLTITAAGLTHSTAYKVWTRTKCEGNYSGWYSVAFETAVPDYLEAAFVLRPVQHAVANYSAPSWNLLVSAAAEPFIDTYGLPTSWLTTNQMKWEDMAAYISDLGASAVTINSGISLMTVKSGVYQTMTGPVPGEVRMFWCHLPETIDTMSFQDFHGNTAEISPVVILDDAYGQLGFLIPEITMDVLSATPTEVVIRLTKSHDAIAVPNVNLTGMGWLLAALGGTADPLEPTNGDKRILTLSPGTHKVGAQAAYRTNDTMTNWPPSRITMTIEVS